MTTAIILNGMKLECPVTEDFIICADGGFKLLKDRKPDIILGDFDSLTDLPDGVPTLRVPAEKNFTDGEMAVRYAHEKNADSVAIYGATGGRIDHVLANFALLKLSYRLGLKAVVKGENFTAEYVEKTVKRTAPIGSTVSLLPFGGDVSVSFSDGLYYPLNPLKITSEGMSRGISNVTTKETFTYGIEQGGAFLIVYPKNNFEA